MISTSLSERKTQKTEDASVNAGIRDSIAEKEARTLMSDDIANFKIASVGSVGTSECSRSRNEAF